jgi:hypothetical protein
VLYYKARWIIANKKNTPLTGSWKNACCRLNIFNSEDFTMILNDLDSATTKRRVRKVFEQYFDSTLSMDNLNKWQARKMLTRVRSALHEHRQTPQLHTSERNPTYLKMMMLEQALTDHLKTVEQPTLSESEVQQAQVVLAGQDMVDSIQKMIEDVSEMQFKELPALVDSIRNQVGTAEADSFNQAASAALSGMVQNLQGSKQQLEQAQAILTGQQMQIPGEEPGAAAAPAPEAGEEEIDLSLDANLPAEEEPAGGGEASAPLGRERR